MPEEPRLRPAIPSEIEDAIAFALRVHGRKRAHHADDVMARITAERLVEIWVRGDEETAGADAEGAVEVNRING